MDPVTAVLATIAALATVAANVSRAWLLLIEAASPETKAGLAERMLKDMNDYHERLDSFRAWLESLKVKPSA